MTDVLYVMNYEIEDVTVQSSRYSKAQPRRKISNSHWPVVRPRHCPVETLLFTPVP